MVYRSPLLAVFTPGELIGEPFFHLHAQMQCHAGQWQIGQLLFLPFSNQLYLQSVADRAVSDIIAIIPVKRDPFPTAILVCYAGIQCVARRCRTKAKCLSCLAFRLGRTTQPQSARFDFSLDIRVRIIRAQIRGGKIVEETGYRLLHAIGKRHRLYQAGIFAGNEIRPVVLSETQLLEMGLTP